MKLPFRKNKEFLSVLYDILGFYPHDVEIYRVAFSHKSLTYHTEPNGGKDRRNGRREKRPRTENTSKPLNNERLEYLGDAVLETVVSDILFRHFEHKREGFLTSTRSKIVQREALNRLAEQMGLEALIQAAQGTRMSHTNIGGNAFEALMGAIYLDRGFKYCHWFITNRVIGTYVDLDTVAQKEVNFKSKLLEWCQKNRINTDFRDSGGADGERGFRTSIVLEGITVGKGSGRSKKESQQVAAKDALSRMRREQKLYDSIFRAKEKRTAMEADESFALPKIDEAEDIVSKAKDKDKPVLEDETGRRKNFADTDGYHDSSDAAYDEAYGDNPKYEVIDDPDNESEYSDYATSIQPDEDDDAQAAPAPAARSQKKGKSAATKDVAKDKAANGKEKAAAGKEKSVSDKEKDKPAQGKDAAEEPERKPQTKAERKRERNRTAKTIDDAVKGSKKVKAEVPAPQPELADAENATDEAAATMPEQKPMSESAKRRQRRKARREAMEADETNPFVELDKERKEEADASSAAEVSSVTDVSSTAEVEEDVLETVELHVAPETDEAKADIEPELSAAEPEAVTTAEEEAEVPVSAEPETPAEPASEEPVAEEEPAVEEPTAEEEPAAEEPVSTTETEPQPAEAPQAEASAEPIEADADDIETDSDDEETPSESGESSEDDNVSDEEAEEVFDEEVPADEEEEEYDDEEEETPSEPHALAEEAALPKLRHISLDDFVFGATDATTFDRKEEATSDEDAESDSASDERRQRNARSRRRKPNRSKKPADKAEKKAEAPKGEGKAKKHNADDAADAQVRIDREKAAKRRAQQRRRRRRESNKGDNFAGEE